jgi:hypothetical protein
MAFNLADFEAEALQNGIAHYFDPSTGQNTFDLFTGGGGGYYDVTGGPTGLKLYNYTGGPIPAELQSLADKYMLASPEAIQAAQDPNGPGNNQGGSDFSNLLTLASFIGGPMAMSGAFGGAGFEGVSGVEGFAGDPSWGVNSIGDSMFDWEQFTPDWFDSGAPYFTETSTPFNWEQFTPNFMKDGQTFWPEGITDSATGPLSKLASALGTSEGNLTKLLGSLIPAGLGAYGASKQSDAFTNLANQFASYGTPYRGKLADLYADPSKFLSSPEVQVPVQQGTDALARSLSEKVGNPIENPTALQDIQNYASNQLFGRLGQEKDRLGGFGALSAYNQAAPGAAANAAGSEGNIFNAIGYGVGNYLNPPTPLEQLLKSLQGSSIFKVA